MELGSLSGQWVRPGPPRDFGLEVARGRMGSYSSQEKFGENSAIGTTEEDVWDGGGTWNEPTADRVHSIASTAAGDTSIPIKVFGLSGGVLTEETVTTDASDGTTGVNTVNSYGIIYRMRVDGSTEPTGNIEATAAVDATITAKILAGNNQTLMAVISQQALTRARGLPRLPAQYPRAAASGACGV